MNCSWLLTLRLAKGDGASGSLADATVETIKQACAGVVVVGGIESLRYVSVSVDPPPIEAATASKIDPGVSRIGTRQQTDIVDLQAKNHCTIFIDTADNEEFRSPSRR